MKTRFTRKSVCSALILMTVFTMLLSALTFGATTRKKLVKSIKEYNADGALVYSNTRTYDKKGKLTGTAYYQKMDGQEYSGKSTSKLTYWKGTNILKKSVEKSGDYTYTYTYNKKGAPLTTISQGPDYYEKTTYKTSGKYPRSSVTVDQNGKKVREVTYDSQGNTKKYTYYMGDGSTSTTLYSSKYRNGIVTKRKITWSDGSTRDLTYDKKGNLIKAVQTDSTGKATTTTYKNKYNKEGYLVEMKAYEEGKLTWRDVYKYTSKTYIVDN